MGCALCEGLLADAERVRRLLFTPDPGPMPQDVWLRLEGAMAAEAMSRRLTSDAAPLAEGAAGWFDAPADTPPNGAHTGSFETGSFETSSFETSSFDTGSFETGPVHQVQPGQPGRGFEAPPVGAALAADDAVPTGPQAQRPGPYAVPLDPAEGYLQAYADAYPADGYPTGGYPTDAYPTGGYPTGGYPTDGLPTGGYPSGGYDTGTDTGYDTDTGRRHDGPSGPDAAAFSDPPALTGAQPAENARPEPVRPAGGAHRSEPAPTVEPVPAPVTVPPPSPPPSMSFDEAPTAAWKAFLDEPEPVPGPPTSPVPIRVGRVVRSSVRSRRDVRTEDKDAGRRRRPLVLGAAAAAALVVAGGLGGAFLLWHGNDDDGGLGSDALPGAVRRGVVSTTGRDYTASTLVAQVRTLIAAPGSAPTPSAPPSGSRSGSPRPSSSVPASGSFSASTSASPVATAGTVADPARLESCLVGLGERDRRPIAVDLGRYQGRDAAIIVLPGHVGGFDIWVVSRQCTSGKETPLAFKSVPG